MRRLRSILQGYLGLIMPTQVVVSAVVGIISGIITDSLLA